MKVIEQKVYLTSYDLYRIFIDEHLVEYCTNNIKETVEDFEDIPEITEEIIEGVFHFNTASEETQEILIKEVHCKTDYFSSIPLGDLLEEILREFLSAHGYVGNYFDGYDDDEYESISIKEY